MWSVRSQMLSVGSFPGGKGEMTAKDLGDVPSDIKEQNWNVESYVVLRRLKNGVFGEVGEIVPHPATFQGQGGSGSGPDL